MAKDIDNPDQLSEEEVRRGQIGSLVQGVTVPDESAEAIKEEKVGVVINGLKANLTLQLTPDEFEELKSLESEDEVRKFLLSKVDRINVDYSESMDGLNRKIIESYGGLAPYHLDPPRGTPPVVTSQNIQHFFGNNGLKVIEGGKGYSYTRYGNNANGWDYIHIELTIDPAKTATVKIPFKEYPDIFSDKLIENAEQAKVQKEEENRRIFEQTVNEYIEKLTTSDIEGLAEKITSQTSWQKKVEIPRKFQRDFIAQYDIEGLKKHLQEQDIKPNDYSIAEDKNEHQVSDTAKANINNIIVSKVSQEMFVNYKESLEETGEFQAYHDRIKDKKDALAQKMRSLPEEFSTTDVIAVILESDNEFQKTPYDYRRRRDLDKDEVLKIGTMADCFEYLRKMGQTVPEEFDEIKRDLYKLRYLISQHPSQVTSKRNLSEIQERFSKPLTEEEVKRLENGKYRANYKYGYRRKDLAEGKRIYERNLPDLLEETEQLVSDKDDHKTKAGRKADVNFLRRKIDEIHSALKLPLPKMFAAQKIYEEYKEAEDDNKLYEIMKILGKNGVKAGLHLSFPYDDLNQKRRSIVLRACKKIEAGIKRFKLEEKLTEALSDPEVTSLSEISEKLENLAA